MIQPITLGGFKSESFSFRNSSSAAAIPAAAPKIAPFLPWKETLLSMLLTFLNGLFAPPCKLTELIEPTTN